MVCASEYGTYSFNLDIAQAFVVFTPFGLLSSILGTSQAFRHRNIRDIRANIFELFLGGGGNDSF